MSQWNENTIKYFTYKEIVRAQKFQMTLHRKNKCSEMAGMNMIHFYV